MSKLKLFMIGIFILNGIQSVFSQDTFKEAKPPYVPSPVETRQQGRERQINERNGLDVNGMIIQPNQPRIVYPPLTAEQAERIRESKRNFEEVKNMLRVPSEYYRNYALALKNKNVGLARIFVDKNCDKGKVVTIQELERCAEVVPIRGGGSFYSFRNRSNLIFSENFADIHFVENKLVVGSPTVFGIIAKVGAVSLENLTLKSKELFFLKTYKPKSSVSEIKYETEIFQKGLDSDGITYSLTAPLEVNSTYVLRSVAYQVEEKDMYDNRVDIIAAFTVIAKEKDGSIILLWKEIKSKTSKKLKA